MAHILVVDDDPIQTRLLRHLLEGEGYTVTTAEVGQKALEYLDCNDFDLILLDVMMPEMTGLDLCQRIRAISDVPILFVTTRSDVADKVLGLRIGGDDYLTKPFEPDEVLARIEALLRRTSGRAQSDLQLKHGGLTLNLAEQSANLQHTDKPMRLTATETRLLHALLKNAGSSVPREALLPKVGGRDAEHANNQLDVYIARLRSKLEEDPKHPKLIQTVKGRGYRFGPAKAPPSAGQSQRGIHRLETSHTGTPLGSSTEAW